jgi:hypothetical protein
MNRIFCFLIFVLTLNATHSQKVVFYSDTLSFTVSKTVSLFMGKSDEKREVLAYYENLKNSNFLLEISSQLLAVKKEYRLNDYFMGQVLDRFCQSVAPKVSNKQQRVLMYCVLGFMGYDVRLATASNGYFVLVNADTEIHYHPFQEIGKTKYYSAHHSSSKGTLNKSYDYIGDKKNKYTFKVTEPIVFHHPVFEETKSSLVSYKYELYGEESESYLRGKIKKVDNDTSYIFLNHNMTLLDCYADLPMIAYENYFYLSVSDSIKNQLLRFVVKDLGSNKQDKLKYLIQFSRLKSQLMPDAQAYKKERPMFPEEALYYKYTDCEDRNALLFYLVREILNLPIIILEYPSHINIAVAIDGNFKQVIKHKGNRYVVCEASSWNPTVKIGESDAFERYPHPKIIGEYAP